MVGLPSGIPVETSLVFSLTLLYHDNPILCHSNIIVDMPLSAGLSLSCRVPQNAQASEMSNYQGAYAFGRITPGNNHLKTRTYI